MNRMQFPVLSILFILFILSASAPATLVSFPVAQMFSAAAFDQPNPHPFPS